MSEDGWPVYPLPVGPWALIGTVIIPFRLGGCGLADPPFHSPLAGGIKGGCTSSSTGNRSANRNIFLTTALSGHQNVERKLAR